MPWAVVTILWPALVAALQPLELAELVGHLPDIITRHAKSERGDTAAKGRSHPRQVDDFRSHYASRVRKAA